MWTLTRTLQSPGHKSLGFTASLYAIFNKQLSCDRRLAWLEIEQQDELQKMTQGVLSNSALGDYQRHIENMTNT